MGNFFEPILRFLGQIFYFMYNTIGFHNFGLTIIFFTLVTKLALMPLTIKSQKSTQEMNALQPEVKKIQEKYKNDKEKQNAEIQKLYKENNVSCMGGCLPMLLQFPILIALYSVLRRPLTLVIGKSTEAIIAIANKLPEGMRDLVVFTGNAPETFDKINQINELKMIDFLSNNPSYLNETVTSADLINLKFLGLDLGKVPQWQVWNIPKEELGIYLPLLIIPVVAVIMTVISQRLMQPPKKDEPKKSSKPEEKNPASGMTNAMKYMIPGMTLYFSFILPASMGLYWICTYTFQIFQTLIMNRMKKKKEEEKAAGTSGPALNKGTGKEKKKTDGGKK
ncbi:MAG: YidC/Oxa1 family membrane protein insertase [Clostridia bacterium]|nr:YidC/Oxa1 family membrane protein insertase [Clostridia bacterium]